ncbi:hypothetical protein [Kineococcus gypseus]
MHGSRTIGERWAGLGLVQREGALRPDEREDAPPGVVDEPCRRGVRSCG